MEQRRSGQASRAQVHADALALRTFGRPAGLWSTKPGQTHFGLEEAHRALEISPDIFDEVAAELGRSLDHFNVPEQEKGEVLAGFAAHKPEVVEGYAGQY
jgi:hemoglobin